MMRTTMAMAVLTVSLAAGWAHADEGQLLSKTALKELTANAKTAKDHERLAQHYMAKAEQLDADAQEHREVAAKYKASGGAQSTKHNMSGPTSDHCENLATQLHNAAEQARALAADHMALAKQCCEGGAGR
jgi:hypothetical protein